MSTAHEFEAKLSAIIERTLPAVFQAIAPFSRDIDANPKGFEAVVLSATLRAASDYIEKGFDEGDKVGPLKTAADEIRMRLLILLQKVEK